MKIGMVSLGCPKNRVDSEVMLGLTRERGYEITNAPEEAEIIIVNTCGFIESAKEESVGEILRMAQYKESGSCRYLLVSGCLAQRYAEELFAELPEADAIVGTDCFKDIAWVLDEVRAGRRVLHLEPRAAANVLPPRILTTPPYLAYLKIAEGCDNCCSYCVIPQIRGPYVSRPLDEVLAEARALAASGVRELVVVAQDTTRYGEDLAGELLLPRLLRELDALEGIRWIRVMYLYPNNFTDELIDAFAELPKVCKYIDIPLQHASDRLLASMNRADTRAEAETLLAKLRARIPGVSIRTTFIVGFPGETEEDFAQLKDFVARQRFENAGVFQYSQEEGTVAGARADQIAPEVKEERYHELMALQAQISEEKHRQREGGIAEVLVEGFEEDGLAYGRSMLEAPDIDGKIFIENAQGARIGGFVRVRLLQGFAYEMVGELL